MMTVSQLSEHGGIPPHVVRYYVRIGLLEPHRDPGNGYKLFSHADARRLNFIRKAQSLGYSLDEIRRFLALSSKGHVSCTEVRAVLERHLAESRAQLRDLIALQRRMRHALRMWRGFPDALADGSDVCSLIEHAAGDEITRPVSRASSGMWGENSHRQAPANRSQRSKRRQWTGKLGPDV